MKEHERLYSESEHESELDRSIDHVRICVVGLGYVGLPLAYEFSEAGHEVSGYDVDSSKIARLESGVDPTGDVGDDAIDGSSIEFTSDAEAIASAEYVIVAVPTPVDDLEKPNLDLVESVGRTVGTHLEDGTAVVLESTVYPGATKEVFVPAIESTAEMTAGESFGVGYSPERMVPGDEKHDLRNVVKIVSALTDETLTEIASLYESVVDAGVHRAPTIETAEAAKCVENTQRDLNIALVNELAVACDHLDVDTRAVLEAAGTKWNFHEYRPGLVGGHCIPVDPFYLIYQSERNDFSPELMRTAREVNEYVPSHVAEMTVKALNEAGNVLRDSRVLVAGLTYKPNVADIRTSKIGGVIDSLQDYGVSVSGFDPRAETVVTEDEFNIDIQEELSAVGFDGILIGTVHDEFYGLSFGDLAFEMSDDPVLVDIDGVFESQAAEHGFVYRRL
ncbi:nucleotide sugar dehydrogenase [Natrarchaeobius halalkaliphilus]|uniref:UDP-N-acetyl-D-mannosamine dehydrogenase n=1 Tax=Natrarchaeobius halalkaliphilus TaxID=1679091 RepID=A0A3N6M789_9EURY|nr:nucleotide sugar dehydrogenase [Natrarchaeobius halalkaliphilus]RQG89216.1 nucleotide sugar dehydrogenase [Natrarchaeobius halalkaliphilus]